MNNKISTSIQYQLSNVVLFNEIFGNWLTFRQILEAGPERVRKFLLDKWNEVREKLKDDDNLIIKDMNKKVTIDDFDATLTKTEEGFNVFIFTFPDYEYKDAASKYSALILNPEFPRYFTLEYSENFLTKEECYVVGEFCIEKNRIQHKNYGTLNNCELSSFTVCIFDILKHETKNN